MKNCCIPFFTLLLLSGLFFFSAAETVDSSPVFSLEDHMEGVPLGNSLEYRVEPLESLLLEDVKSSEFTTAKSDAPGLGFHSDTIWTRFSLTNPGENAREIYLELAYPLYDHIVFYDAATGEELFIVGDHFPFEERPIKYRNFVFPLTFAAGEQREFYMKINTESSINLPMLVWTPRAFAEKINWEQLPLGMSYGIVIIMFLYNLSIFLFTRDKSYVYYIMFVAFYGFFATSINGIAFEFFWPNWITWSNISLPFFMIVTSAFGLLFGRQFLNLREYLPRAARGYLIAALSAFVFGFVSLALPYSLTIKVAAVTAFSAVIALLSAGIYTLHRGYKPAIYFLSAWGILILGIILYVLKTFGVVPNNFFTNWGIQIGAVLEVFLLSVALADKINRLEEEKEQTWTALNRAYGRFVPHAFLNFLEKANILEVDLGNQVNRKMSILFCDIRNFTGMSEKMTPQENFEFINEYLNRVVPAIHLNSGVVDKYIGDAIMALFPGPPETAVQAAIDIQDTIALYNEERLHKGQEPIRSGIGIHTGNLMLGTIGIPEHMQGSVIADAVNLAARLESMTKALGADIIMSSTTMYEMENPEKFSTRFLGQIRVKGKKENIAVFEVLDALPRDQLNKRMAHKKNFRRGVEAFFQKKYTDARSFFQGIHEECPDDRAVQMYLRRIDNKGEPEPDSQPV